jgi:hypothetical protein
MTIALTSLGQAITQLGKWLTLEQADSTDARKLLAETESTNFEELIALLEMLETSGLVAVRRSGGGGTFQPTVEGWRKLDDLRRPRSDSSQVFVAMWFNDLTDDAYVGGIEPALRETGYNPIRIDKKEHNNKIDDEIIAEIRRSRFLVADFTCEPKNARGGVYYEAGFAQGLGIPVIWTCKDTSLADLHFDTRQYSHIVWRTPVDLCAQLKNRIGATIGDGPLSKSQVRS